jgi:alpha-tubulin suppressor-like RCC1 family protein
MSIQYTKQTQPRGVGKSLFTALAIFFASIVAVVGGANVQPANAAAMNGFTQVSTGTQFTCAVKSDGTVWCWGYNNVGQLGNGTTTNASRPVQVTGLTNATQVASADTASCALKSDGTVWCWGGGRLGNGSAAGSTVPVQVSDLTTAIQISGKFQHFCALKSDQNVVCWGWNALNIMGDSTGTDRLVPTAPNPALPMGVVQVSSGVFGTSVLLSDGTVRSWGAGNNGALGNGSTTYSTSTKTAPTGLSTVSKISGGPGWGNLCAIETTGSVVKCWGLNNNGQLGIGVRAESGADYWRLTPVVVSGFTSTVTAIDVGIDTPCAVLADTTLMCWGYNGDLQAGVSGTQVLTPTAVPNMTGVSQVSPGYYHSCAVLSDTTVKCWGRNTYGALGNNTTTNSVAAVSVLAPPTTLSTPTSVTATATASTEKSIDVSWDASTGASSYTVKIYNAAGASVLGTKASVTGTSTTITASTYSAIANNTAYKITVTAIGDAGVNYNNSAESAQASVTTNPPNLVISTPSSGLLGTANSAYSLTVAGSGGIAPLTYALTGTLVAGLNFNTSTGVISGTPNVSGSQIFSVTMTDSRSVSVSTANFTIAIASATTTVSIALADATPTYGVTNRITATTSQAGTVNFKAGSATISGCGAVTATSTAICDWVPSSVGSVALTAVLTPTASGTYSGSTSSALNKTVALATQAGLTLTSTSGTYGTDLTLAATGGSGGGALSYVVTTAGTAGCSILSGNLLSATAPGTCTVTATRAASTIY